MIFLLHFSKISLYISSGHFELEIYINTRTADSKVLSQLYQVKFFRTPVIHRTCLISRFKPLVKTRGRHENQILDLIYIHSNVDNSKFILIKSLDSDFLVIYWNKENTAAPKLCQQKYRDRQYNNAWINTGIVSKVTKLTKGYLKAA